MCGVCTGLVRVYSGKARTEREIRGGEGGLETGCNSRQGVIAKAEMGPHRIKNHVPVV